MFAQLIEAVRLEARTKEQQAAGLSAMAKKAVRAGAKRGSVSSGGMLKSGDAATAHGQDFGTAADKKLQRGLTKGQSPDPLRAKARRSPADLRKIMRGAAKEGQRVRFKKADLPR
jgi:hypothetical protein